MKEMYSGQSFSNRDFLSSDSHLIDAPAHYVSGRQIEPIEVMERWGLIQNHYMACAFKYVARVGRKGDPVVDLEKALWYLDRFEGKGSCLMPTPVLREEVLTPQDLCLDWGVTPSSLKGQIFQCFYDIASGQSYSLQVLKKLIFDLRYRLGV